MKDMLVVKIISPILTTGMNRKEKVGLTADIGVPKNKNSSLKNRNFNQTSECRKFGLFRDPQKKVDWDGLVDDIFTDEIAKLADQVRNNISHGIDFK